MIVGIVDWIMLRSFWFERFGAVEDVFFLNVLSLHVEKMNKTPLVASCVVTMWRSFPFLFVFFFVS